MQYFEICKGTVEDNCDPLQKSRLRVRLDGYHTQLNQDGGGYTIMNEELDWYPVLMPSTSSSRDGKGNSPSGILIGDRVLVYILDEYIQSVLVVGTIHGDDDTSDLSHGGLDGLTSDSVERTNSNLTRAPMLDRREYVRDLIENDDVGYQTFIDALIFDEGVMYKTYYDQFRYPHIGIGTLLIKQQHYSLDKAWTFVEKRLGRRIPEKVITKEDAMFLAESDINKIIAEIPRYSLLNQAYNSVSQTRKYGLISMCYQMGTAGVAKFTSSLNLILAEEWEAVYRNLLKSKWASQTPSRASRVASILRDNNFSQYPIASSNKGSGAKYKAVGVDRALRSVPYSTEFTAPKTPSQGTDTPPQKYPDLTEIQLQIIEQTKTIRKLMNIQSLNDIREIVRAVRNYDKFIDSIKNLFTDIKDYVKSLRDIKIMEFIQKYIDRFKDLLRQMVDDLVKYVQRVASDIQEELNLAIKAVEILIERIIFGFNSIGTDISDFIGDVVNFFSMEDEESDEGTGIMFTEPPSEYASEYPHIKTEISASGHIREIDDTPGFERIKETHRSGTYREINADGRLAEKTVSDKYLIVEGDDHVYIVGHGKLVVGGTMRIHVQGNSEIVTHGDCKTIVRGDLNAEVSGNSNVLTIGNLSSSTRGNAEYYTKGNVKLLTDGNVDMTTKGNVTLLTEGNVDMTTKGNVTGVVEGTSNLTLKGDVGITAESNVNMKVSGTLTTNVDGDYNTNVSGVINMSGSSTVNIKGSRINFIRG